MFISRAVSTFRTSIRMAEPVIKKMKVDVRPLSTSPKSPGSPKSPVASKASPASAESIVDFIKSTKREVKNAIVWVDCEMTGLDVFNDNIIEICCLITDGDLNIIDEDGYESTVFQPKEKLDAMNEWCVNQHNKSGLVPKILANPQQTLSKVQTELYEYITKYVPNKRSAVMAGNTIHMDKFFMMKEFPQVIEHLHYRLIDVSTVMEFGRRHNPDLMDLCPKKTGQHTAKADIMESISQMKWYQQNYFKSKEETADFVKQNNLDTVASGMKKLQESTRKT